MDELVVFDHTVESMFLRALDQRLSAAALEELKGIGIDLSRRLLPAYPLPVWLKSLDIAARHVFPDLSADRAHFELGQLMVTSYQATFMGRALFAMLKLLSPRRVIDRMTRNFRTANNYSETRVTELSENACDVWVNIVEKVPTFTQGVLATGLALVGVPQVKVEIVRREGDSVVYRINWGA